ncbi:MAG: PIN domain-containing protein [Actinomycetota bacterium]|nr:PIN domain-containing protein [Actinomycetota bacterium]
MSEPIFVDTNVFLRFFVADVEDLYEKAKDLFEKAEKGEIKLVTSEMVIAEIIWVLESYYGFLKEEVKDVIKSLLHTKGLKVMNANLIEEAIEKYKDDNMEFINAYNGCLVKKRGYKRAATFDKRLSKDWKE